MLPKQLISTQSLKYYPHFAGLDEKSLEQIALISDKVEFEAGDELLVEGSLATHFCLIESGEVSVVYKLGDNRTVVADTLIKGEVFGWSALLEPHQSTATCVGHKRGACIRIDGKGLRQMCDTNPTFGYNLAIEVAKLLRDRLSALRVQIAAAR